MKKEDITIYHTLAYYTFWPTVILVLICMPSGIVAWLLGYTGPSVAFATPWLGVMIFAVWVSLLGEYVIPSQSYRWAVNEEYDD